MRFGISGDIPIVVSDTDQYRKPQLKFLKHWFQQQILAGIVILLIYT